MIRADKRRQGLGPGGDTSPGFNPSNARGRRGTGASANTRQVNAKCFPVLWGAPVCIRVSARGVLTLRRVAGLCAKVYKNARCVMQCPYVRDVSFQVHTRAGRFRVLL